MPDQDENQNGELGDISDDEAEQLLADAVAEQDQSEKPVADDKDWKAEAERWKSLSRKNEKSFKDTSAKLKQYEDQNKTELQRLQEERDSGMTRAEKAEAALKRRELAEQFAPEHATVAQIKAVAKRLSGADDDELEADAKELFELIAPEPKAAPKVAGSRPKERLKGGSEPDEAPEVTDPRKLADLIPRRR
jgi:hypothetical protein